MVCDFSWKTWFANYYFSSLYFKMSKQVTVKYFEETDFAKEPCQATEGSAGYDLYAAEPKSFLPSSADTISLDLR